MCGLAPRFRTRRNYPNIYHTVLVVYLVGLTILWSFALHKKWLPCPACPSCVLLPFLVFPPSIFSSAKYQADLVSAKKVTASLCYGQIHTHLLTAECQQLPLLYQRRKPHRRPLLQSNPRRKSMPLPYFHFPITSTARHHKSYPYITLPNAAGISIRLEYGRLKGTSRSLEKR